LVAFVLPVIDRTTVWLTHRRFEQNNKTENHFFCQVAAADRAEGGQVEPVLGAL
jgi:hypothetical protein